MRNLIIPAMQSYVPGYNTKGARLLREVAAKHGTPVDFDRIAPARPVYNPPRKQEGR